LGRGANGERTSPVKGRIASLNLGGNFLNRDRSQLVLRECNPWLARIPGALGNLCDPGLVGPCATRRICAAHAQAISFDGPLASGAS
jgi:hypothetical protein